MPVPATLQHVPLKSTLHFPCHFRKHDIHSHAQVLESSENPLATMWRSHFRVLPGPDLLSVDTVKAHVAKFHSGLVADGLADSKLPAETIDKIAAFLANVDPETGPPHPGWGSFGSTVVLRLLLYLSPVQR